MTSRGASIESLPETPSTKKGASQQTSSRRGVAPEGQLFQYFSALAGSVASDDRRSVDNSRLLPRPGRDIDNVSSRSAVFHA